MLKNRAYKREGLLQILKTLHEAGQCFILLCFLSCLTGFLFGETIYPGAEWLTSTPAQQGMLSAPIAQMDSLMAAAQANGVLIRNGYVIAEWNYAGTADKKIETQSITKSINSMVLGLAIQEGKVASLDSYVHDYYPTLDLGPYTAQITFRQLANLTSGMPTSGYTAHVPGTDYHYHNDVAQALAKILTYVYEQQLVDIARDRIVNEVGATMNWGTSGDPIVTDDGISVPVNAGFAYTYWAARDLARIGWLYLNNGKWNDQQLLDASFIQATFTGSSANANYGLAWYKESHGLGWYMSGNGGQFCWVVPEHNIVLVKLNSYSLTTKKYISDFYPLLVASLAQTTDVVLHYDWG